MKKASWLYLVLIVFMILKATHAFADVGWFSWLTDAADDPEQKASSVFEQIVTFALLIASGLCAVNIVVGFAKWGGMLFDQDKQEGASRIKRGGIGIGLCVSFGVLTSFIFKIFGA